jgi:hypothetical protein
MNNTLSEAHETKQPDTGRLIVENKRSGMSRQK